MMQANHLPSHSEIRLKDTCKDMLSDAFGTASVIVCPRILDDDFTGLSKWVLKQTDPRRYEHLDLDKFKSLIHRHRQSNPFKRQTEYIIADMTSLQEAGFRTELRATFNADIYFLFHIDPEKNTPEAKARGKSLTFYEGLPTEGLLSHQAIQDRPGSAGWVPTFIPKNNEQPFAFRLGDFWRHAERDSSPTAKPFIHRACNGGGYRLGIVGN